MKKLLPIIIGTVFLVMCLPFFQAEAATIGKNVDKFTDDPYSDSFILAASSSGVDWNNKPWLNWQVQNCVRRYLREVVLTIENEEQRRNNQPVFTNIDEWGRLINMNITTTGKVDGAWENPTHYVWYAYNRDPARRKYGYTVEQWVKQFCMPNASGGGTIGGTSPPAQPGGGSGPGTGQGGIDWNNKPWLNWQVQNCVRRYLREVVLTIENEEQRRNNQPVFTNIDEWGRLINMNITTTGKVDGAWENPTHYVWYAYNRDPARRKYGYTVEQWVKQFCMPNASGGGTIGGTSPPAQPGGGSGPGTGQGGIDWNNKPWLNWQVQNCVRRYLREVVLTIENEEQRRNNQPVFTNIDEWGRLINMNITTTGKVDGAWENPTHYVWYAYNRDPARRKYGYTVEQWVKQFCMPNASGGGTIGGTSPPAQPGGGSGPGTGQGGIDWNNKPWLNWQVQNCVRRYLREVVLTIENEEQRRNNQPVFTNIDEWGRLINMNITTTGKVDGAWENPTHYVWYAYNRDPARRKYGYTVEQWVKQFCMPNASGGGTIGGTSPPAQPGGGSGPGTGQGGIDWNNKPWLNWQVQNCVRRYLREVVLTIENEEQRRNNQPVFTNIDEWGRLINMNITTTGKVDGAWENPTHYVWYAYNRDPARRKYGYTVEQWVKQFCMPNASGARPQLAPAPAPTRAPAPPPAAPVKKENWFVTCSLRTSNMYAVQRQSAKKMIIPDREEDVAGPFSSESAAIKWLKKNCPSQRCDAFARCFQQTSASDVMSGFTSREEDRSHGVTDRTRQDTYADPGQTQTNTDDLLDDLTQMSDAMTSKPGRHDPSTSERPHPPAQPAGGQVLTDITVDSDTVTIEFWDHRSEDGDIIDILLNGRPLKSNILLKNAHQSFPIQLKPGKNVFGVRAVNEGTSPPNTATVKFSNVTSGKDVQVYSIKTGNRTDMNINVSQ